MCNYEQLPFDPVRRHISLALDAPGLNTTL